MGNGGEDKSREEIQCPDSKFHLELRPNEVFVVKAKDLKTE